MNLYLDTELDGHGGELISLALAADDGNHWYGVTQHVPTNEWVREHVHPHIFRMPCTINDWQPPEEFRVSLRQYMGHRAGCTIWADWPADFEHLMRLMAAGPSYDQSFMVPCTMQLIETAPGEPKPEIPHNALSDAIALMQWHQRQA